jgi:signal peptidase II
LVIIGVTLFLGSYAYHRWHDNKIIIGEVIVLAGGISNLIDRALYQGVIDFIALSWGPLSWPVFNVADVCIVFGVFLMGISVYRDHD